MAEMTDGRHKHRWRGQMIVLSLSRLNIDSTVYQDVTIADLHHATDYSKSFDDGLGVNRELKLGDQPVEFEKVASIERFLESFSIDGEFKRTSWGVLISCKRSQMLGHQPKYAAVKVPHAHPMFTLKATTLSKIMKLPLITYQNQTIPPFSESGWSPFANSIASAMDLDLEVLSDTWGEIDQNS